MKKVLQFCAVALMAIGTMMFVGCEKDDGHTHQDHGGDQGGNKSLTFKNANIAGQSPGLGQQREQPQGCQHIVGAL